jgi:HlyD family secretion protein
MTPNNTAARPASARRARRRWSSAAVAFIVVTAGIVYWRKLSAAPPAEYVTAEVTRGAVTPSVTASGTVNPVITVQVGSYVSGVIQSLYCDYNTTVKKGQLCARIDPRPFSIVVDQDQADLDTAKAQLDKDQASLNYATLSYERGAALLKSGLESQDALDSLKSAEGQGKAQIEVDKATVEQKQASLAAAKINLGYTNIISPVNGTVVSRNVTVGQTVAASFQTPTLFLIANDLTKMQIDTNVSEGDIGGLRTGDEASFTVDAFPGRAFKGQVAQVRQAPQSVQNVITYDVVINVANPDLLLMPGMTAAVHINVDQSANALRVPDRALRFTPAMAGARPTPTAGGASHPAAEARGGAGVWVLRDGRAVHVPITVGLDDGSNAEVRSGALAAGDQVIVSEQTSSAPVTRGLRPFRP